MKTKHQKLALLGAIAAAGFLTKSVLAGAGCCASAASSPACSDQAGQAQHEGHAQQTVLAQNTSGAAPTKPLSEAAASVLPNYVKIEASLAKDSLNGVGEAAKAISNVAAADESKSLPVDVATQADALAKAKDLAAARESFKQLSASLIQYLERQKVQTGRYYKVYCAMAKASWLQADKAVKNPYYGKSMLTCGQIAGAF